jgi:hypothetical protein
MAQVEAVLKSSGGKALEGAARPSLLPPKPADSKDPKSSKGDKGKDGAKKRAQSAGSRRSVGDGASPGNKLSSLQACISQHPYTTAELLRRSRVHTRPYGCRQCSWLRFSAKGSSKFGIS